MGVLVQTTTQFTAGATSITATFGAAPSRSNVMVGGSVENAGGPPGPFSGAATWVNVGSVAFQFGSALDGTTSVSCPFTISDDGACVIGEFSGTTPTLDTSSANGSGASSTATTPAFTTTNALDLIVVRFVFAETGATYSGLTAGYAQVAKVDDGVGQTIILAYRFVSAIQSAQTVSITSSNAAPSWQARMGAWQQAPPGDEDYVLSVFPSRVQTQVIPTIM